MNDDNRFSKYVNDQGQNAQTQVSNNRFAKYATPVKNNKVEEDIATGEWTNLDSLSGA